jgi:hypothetical protein
LKDLFHYAEFTTKVEGMSKETSLKEEVIRILSDAEFACSERVIVPGYDPIVCLGFSKDFSFAIYLNYERYAHYSFEIRKVPTGDVDEIEEFKEWVGEVEYRVYRKHYGWADAVYRAVVNDVYIHKSDEESGIIEGSLDGVMSSICCDPPKKIFESLNNLLEKRKIELQHSCCVSCYNECVSRCIDFASEHHCDCSEWPEFCDLNYEAECMERETEECKEWCIGKCAEKCRVWKSDCIDALAEAEETEDYYS